MLVTGLTAASPAAAQQVPAGCGGNESDFRYIRDPTNPARPGDAVKFIVYAHNTGVRPCNISLLSNLVFTLPAANGTPTGAQTTIWPNGTPFPATFPLTQIAEIPWTVAVDRGVTDAVTTLTTDTRVYDAAVPQDYRVYRSLGTDVTQPEIKIDKIGSITAGQAPQNVVYTFNVENTSSTVVPMDRVAVDDDKCGTPTLVTKGGDGDDLLENGEVWTYTCSMLHQAPGVYTNTAKVCAYSTVPGDTTRPVCSPPDTWTVTLSPPPPPQVAVKPASATQAPCDIVSPSGLRVRARELTTIRVRVRNVDAGSTATITLPGGKKVSAKTNASGIATFRVRPTRTGRASIRMAECGDVARFSVRPARQTQTRRAPRVTG